MVELRCYPAEEGSIARYAVAVVWHTYDEELAILLEQAAIRQDLALRISKQAIAYPGIFERYGYSFADSDSETAEHQLRAALLDEARRLIDMAHGLVGPDVTAAERQAALAMFETHYHDLSDLRHDENATVVEWALKTLAEEGVLRRRRP